MAETTPGETQTRRVHLIAGGFPPGSYAGHDQDYARLRLLTLLNEHDTRPRWRTISPMSKNGCRGPGC